MYTESPDHQDSGQSSLPAEEVAYQSCRIFATQRSSNPNISLLFPSLSIKYGCMIDDLLSYEFYLRAIFPVPETPKS